MESRNKEQEIVMKIVYNHLFNTALEWEKDPRDLIAEIVETPYEEASTFIKNAVIKSLIHQEEILHLIEENLHNWTLARLNKVTVAILLFSIAQYRYIQEIDKSAMIDVAVDLSKKYCDDNDYKFVNAILDKVL